MDEDDSFKEWAKNNKDSYKKFEKEFKNLVEEARKAINKKYMKDGKDLMKDGATGGDEKEWYNPTVDYKDKKIRFKYLIMTGGYNPKHFDAEFDEKTFKLLKVNYLDLSSTESFNNKSEEGLFTGLSRFANYILDSLTDKPYYHDTMKKWLKDDSNYENFKKK